MSNAPSKHNRSDSNKNIHPALNDPLNIAVQQFRRACALRNCSQIVPLFLHTSIVETVDSFVYSLHRHPHYEVILVDRSTYRCLLNKVRLELQPGQGLIVKPGDWHQDFCERPLRYYSLGFRFDERWYGERPPSLFRQDVLPPQQCFLAQDPDFVRILAMQRSESGLGSTISAQLQDALMLEFFWRVVRALPAEGIEPDFTHLSNEQTFSNRLMCLFQTHLHEDLSVEEMAEALELSPRSLTQKCQAVLKATPARAFMRCKLDKAREYILHTDLSIVEISRRFHFSDPYHFSKVFKKHFGQAPSMLRNNAIQSQLAEIDIFYADRNIASDRKFEV